MRTLTLIFLIFLFSPAMIFAQETALVLGTGTAINIKSEGEAFQLAIGNPATCLSRSFLPSESDPELGLEAGQAYNTFMVKQNDTRDRLFISWEWASDSLMTRWEETLVSNGWKVKSVPFANGTVKKGDQLEASLVELGEGQYHVNLAVTRSGNRVTEVTLGN